MGVLAGVICCLGFSAAASESGSHRVLKVGPAASLHMPSAAAAAAQPGDEIEIESGTYVDCAVWPAQASSVTITAAGDGPVIIADKVCENKAAFVVKGDDVTVRGITFTGAKTAYYNGAGIRAEGRNLTVEGSQFLNNQEGILAGPHANSTIVIRDSYFKGNGNCEAPPDCDHGIYINRVDTLVVEHCIFVEQYVGHHIKSRAVRTELIGNTIEDGPNGTASYLVDIPDGGALVMRNNVLEKGPKSENHSAAVMIGEESNRNPTPEIVVEDNFFSNGMPGQTLFVRNLTRTPAVLRANTLSGRVAPLEQASR